MNNYNHNNNYNKQTNLSYPENFRAALKEIKSIPSDQIDPGIILKSTGTPAGFFALEYVLLRSLKRKKKYQKKQQQLRLQKQQLDLKSFYTYTPTTTPKS
jgi:hypothetical protein